MRLRMISWAPVLLAIGLISACQNRSPPMEPTAAGGDDAPAAPAGPAHQAISPPPTGGAPPSPQPQTPREP